MNLFIFLLILEFSSINAPSTTKKKPLVLFDGYEYRQKGTSKDEATQFWQCTRNNCPGRAHSPINTEDLHLVTPHTHVKVNAEHQARLAKENMKEQARTEVLTQPRNIISGNQAELTDDARAYMPNYVASQRMVERERQIPERENVDAETLANIVIQGTFSVDHQNNQFLLVDSRIADPENVVFFIFCTPDGMRRLRTYREWSSDGTFKVVPKKLLQLMTINVIIDQSSIPSAFVLMANKAQNTYSRVLQALHENVQVAPISIMMDFELAAMNAYSAVYENAIIRTCLFHLGQSIHRKIQRNGLIGLYEDDEEYRKAVRSLAALSFLPPIRVEYAFQLLRNKVALMNLQNAAADSIFEYFKNTYIVRPNGNPPQFPILSWNHRQSVLDNLGRTNNAQEGYHLALRKQFTKEHPNLSRLITVLKDEERIAFNKIRQYELDPDSGVATHPRNKKYIENDKAIKKRVTEFDDLIDPTDDQILAHLRALQYRLQKNNFDNWDM